jgi:hypothetical protein
MELKQKEGAVGSLFLFVRNEVYVTGNYSYSLSHTIHHL